jgi:hypothetical protein
MFGTCRAAPTSGHVGMGIGLDGFKSTRVTNTGQYIKKYVLHTYVQFQPHI